MSRADGQSGPQTLSWADDMWGGLAAMLVALPSSVAFGILVYTAFGQEYAGQGAMAGLLGVQVFARLALTIAESLRQSDAELRILEER